MAELLEVTRLVQDTYTKIWRDWYASRPDCVPATVTVDLDCTSDGYGHDLNRIIISLGDANLDDWDILDVVGWPAWKIQLIHEMLHEYERKVLTAPSESGRALFAARPHPFWGPGHEALFYTAICDRAQYFRVTPEQFIGHL